MAKKATSRAAAKTAVKKKWAGHKTAAKSTARKTVTSKARGVPAAKPKAAKAVKAKPGMLGWFVGQVMKTTGGKANPQAVNDILKKKLNIS